MKPLEICDYLIVGGGVVGLTVAWELKKRDPKAAIILIEKEKEVAFHASGRNSGVIHAGFYYSANSLKAKLTAKGNKQLKTFCQEHRIPVNNCGKVVVAQHESEIAIIEELYRRGVENKVEIQIVDLKELRDIDPNAKSIGKALYSPSTASVDPKLVCQTLFLELKNKGVKFFFDTKFISYSKTHQQIHTSKQDIQCSYFINCAGLYADKIAKSLGFGRQYTIMPFRGNYIKYTGNDHPIRTHIYPVPNLNNPFLGVHYTITHDGHIKLGPTATPAFWRENYAGWSRFKLFEFLDILSYQTKLFTFNAFGFRHLALEEIKKYNFNYFASLAINLTKEINPKSFNQKGLPGIRAQLLNKSNLKLENDFIIEGDSKSIHILNAVSPAFTCSFSISKVIADSIYTFQNR